MIGKDTKLIKRKYIYFQFQHSPSMRIIPMFHSQHCMEFFISRASKWFGKDIRPIFFGVKMPSFNQLALDCLTYPMILNVDVFGVVTDLVSGTYHGYGGIAVDEEWSQGGVWKPDLSKQPYNLPPSI